VTGDNVPVTEARFLQPALAAAEIAARLEAATTATIDRENRATTSGG